MLVHGGSGPENGGIGYGQEASDAEQIITKLREAEVELAREMKVPEVCKKLGTAE